MRIRIILIIFFLNLIGSFLVLWPASANGVLDSLVEASRTAPPVLYEGSAKTYGDGRMTPETLKSCLILAHRIDQTNEFLADKKSRIRKLDDRIQEAGPQLRDKIGQSLSDQPERVAFAQQVAAYNEWVEQRLDTVRSHNRQVREFSEMSKRFDGECNGRAYYPSDLATIARDLPPEIQTRLK